MRKTSKMTKTQVSVFQVALVQENVFYFKDKRTSHWQTEFEVMNNTFSD